MDNLREPGIDAAISSIAALRQAWLDAVRAGDAEQLAAMATDDVVVVHGDGRCIHGRDELKMDFLKGFESFSIEQTVTSAEDILRGRRAFEIAEVQRSLTPIRGGESTAVCSTTVAVLGRQPDGLWKVERVLGVLDSPLSREFT